MLETALAPTDRLIGPLPRGMIAIEDRYDEVALSLAAISDDEHPYERPMRVIRSWSQPELAAVQAWADAVFYGRKRPPVPEVLRG